MIDFDQARRNMVDCQLRTYDVNDRAILAAMGELPRERFVPPGREALAYIDQSVVVAEEAGERRQMLSPMVLARLVQALAVEPGLKALDVASGTGFSAALLARLGAVVTMLDAAPFGGQQASDRLASLGLAATAETGPLPDGAPATGPFDVILVNGALERRPDTLLAQLTAAGGRLACLQSESGTTRAVLYVRSGEAIGFRTLFDAAGPVLAAFRREPEFAF